MADLATADDVAALYGEITDAGRVAVLLRQASRQARVVSPLVDAKIDDGDLDARDVADVVAAVVARALSHRPGVKQESETRGPFSRSVTYDERGAAGVFFTDDEVAALGGSTAVSRRRFGTVVPCPRW